MREVRFRGKREDNGEWVIGSLKVFNDNRFAILQQIEAGFMWLVDPATIGQFFGFKDRNGVDIYEGDLIEVERSADSIIVECRFGTIERQMGTGFLCDITGFYFEREDGCQTFPIKKNYKNTHDLNVFNVIGNIHDLK